MRKPRITTTIKDRDPLHVLHFGSGRGTRLGLAAYASATAEIAFTKLYDALVRRKGRPPALAFLKRIKALRAVDSFAAQYWFYCQIYALGRTGQTEPGKSVLAALLEVERTHKAWLKARRAATPA